MVTICNIFQNIFLVWLSIICTLIERNDNWKLLCSWPYARLSICVWKTHETKIQHQQGHAVKMRCWNYEYLSWLVFRSRYHQPDMKLLMVRSDCSLCYSCMLLNYHSLLQLCYLHHCSLHVVAIGRKQLQITKTYQ